MKTEPVLVVGSGAIGAIVGFHLLKSGRETHFVDANKDHVRAVRESGLRVSGTIDETLPATIMTPTEVRGRYPVVLLAVKAPHTLEALPMVSAALDPGGCVVSLQNGLEEYKIADAVGAERTIGAYLTFGGFYVEPGHVKYGGTGSFKIGEIDGSRSRRVAELANMLSTQQPVDVTTNIFGFLWAKMALGAVYFGTAVVDADVVDIYDHAQAREILGRLCSEVVAVADAMQVMIETSDSFDPQAFRAAGHDSANVATSWEAQRAYWNSHDNKRTGVWRDLAIHKRPTEVDFQIKPVIELAQERGVAVPHLRRLYDVVKTIEDGSQPLSMQALLSVGRA